MDKLQQEVFQPVRHCAVGCTRLLKKQYFTIRVSDHPLDHPQHKRDYEFEIILKPPPPEEAGGYRQAELEFFLKSSQTRSAVRAARRHLTRWLYSERDRRNGRIPAQGRSGKRWN